MSKPIRASGTLHWVGAGLSTGSGLRVLANRANRVMLWGRRPDRVQACIERLGLRGQVHPNALSADALESAVGPGDVVVSMLPTTEHVSLLQLCLRRGAHFACSSYVSESIAHLAMQAAERGLTVLTEAGLDPGIDHLFAHDLIALSLTETGDDPADAVFTSYCGGIPEKPNGFRYRFSWAPHGVLAALRTPARHIEGGAERVVDRPWEAVKRHIVAGEAFEVYPNRDSLPFVTQYHIPPSWRLRQFVRGTLRLAGWHQAWSEVFDVLADEDAVKIRELANTLAARYPTTSMDRDRVVLTVALTLSGATGRSWHGEYLLDMVGNDAESAMATCVSVSLAVGVCEVLDGRTGTGLRRAGGDTAETSRWLAGLREHGISFTRRIESDRGSSR